MKRALPPVGFFSLAPMGCFTNVCIIGCAEQGFTLILT